MPGPQAPTITFRDLTLGYERHPAVHHLSLQIEPGALVAVVGPNGAGKSSLIKALAGVLAPLIEETLFRGLIFGSLRKYCGKWTAAVISAAIFSGLHFQLYGFIPRFILGIALVYLFDKYKSLYPSMRLHSLNNIIATLLAASYLG